MLNKPLTTLVLMCLLLNISTMISRQRHILPTLLCLESLMLLLILIFPLNLNSQLMKMNLSVIILLMMSVCSASIGLALLVLMSRKQGNDTTLMHMAHTC